MEYPEKNIIFVVEKQLIVNVMTKLDFKDYLDNKFNEAIKAGRHIVHINNEWAFEISYIHYDYYGIDVRRFGGYTGKDYQFKKKDWNRVLAGLTTWMWNRI